MRRDHAMRRAVLRRIRARTLRPDVERVEGRVMLSTYTVINTTDTAATGSLRWAIGQSNGSPGSNTINFDIATSGLQTIAITSALPKITVPVTIDGTTEPGYTTTPLIELNGAGAGAGVDGLDISAGNSTVKGLAINRFADQGINLSVAGGNTITKDFLGTDPTGTIPEGNKEAGVLVQVNSDNNVISGNLISGNLADGVNLDGQLFGATNPVTSGNLIAGNLIGTDVTGELVLASGGYGVSVQNAPTTTIGGTTAAARNILSGYGTGIGLNNFSDGTIVEGNYIGTDIQGKVALGNNGTGGFFSDNIANLGISNTTIGGTATGAGNVISGGKNYGIDSFPNSNGNGLAIQGNLIGTDASGTLPLGNMSGGVFVWGQTNETIGGTVAAARNVISANGATFGSGIGGFANGAGLLIEGNYIGTSKDGLLPLGNAGDGVAVSFTGVTVGGVAAGQANIIANNGFTSAFDHSGVRVNDEVATILSNSIYNNMMLGIEVTTSGTAPPVPVLTLADSMNTTSTVAGILTAPAGTYTLQFFTTPTLNTSGNAEGQTLLGMGTVTSTGTATNFTLILPSGFTPGSYITATATDPAGETSQFSVGLNGTGIGGGLGPPTITATASSSTVAAGQDVTDTFSIANPFTASDDGVILADPIPTGTTFVSGTTSTGVPVTFAGGVATAAIGALPAGETVTVSIVLMTSPAAVPSFTNTGTLTSTTPPSLATASVTTDVTASADLAVAITGPTTATLVGQNLTYVVTVTNNGPSDATQVLLDDALPAGVTFVSAVASSGPAPTESGGMVTDSYGDLAEGASFTVTIIVTAGVASVPTATDTAGVAAFEPDPDPTNNTAAVSSDITPAADVLVSIVTSSPKVGVGDHLVYTVTVTNDGPSDATGVIFNDILPTAVTFVSASDSTGMTLTDSGGTVNDFIGALVAGDSVIITIAVVPTGAAPPSITDTAVVSANEFDSNMANNMATAVTAVFPIADLAIVSQTVTPDPVVEGTPVTITIEVTNFGPSTATSASITGMLPAGLTFVSGIADGGAVTMVGALIFAPIGDLANGASSIVTIVAMTVASGSLTVVNSATEGGVIDPDPTNNTATTTFQSVAVADLALTLSGTAGPVYTGDSITYTAVITNNGPSPATNVTFTDPLFAGATFVAVQSGATPGSLVNGVVVQPLGTLAAGASVTVFLVVIPNQPGTVVDTATVSGTEPDPNQANNTASVTTSLIIPQSLIAFSSASFTANSTDGYAAITLDRSGYEEDSVTVHFSTVGGNATPGVDYLPTSQTVTIPAGSTSVVVFVPVLNNLYDNHDVVVDLQIDTPTGSAILESGGGTSPANAQLTIIDVNPDLVGPTITDLRLVGYINNVTAIAVDTSGHLDPSTATNPANYTITALGGLGKTGLPYGTVVQVVQAIYDPTTGTVGLTLARPLPGNELFVVVVRGVGPGALADLAGNPLNSVVGVKLGSSYTLIVARGTNITYHDNNDIPVTLKLTGPGTLDIDQYPDGQLQFLQVLGGVGGRTTVTATAKPLLRRAIIGSILGLGQFGSIRLKLTTPPFYVNTPPYPNLQTQVGPAAIDVLLPTPPPAPKVTKHVAKASATAPASLHSVKAASIASTSTLPGPIAAQAALIPNPEAPAVHEEAHAKVKVTVSGSRHPKAAKVVADRIRHDR